MAAPSGRVYSDYDRKYQSRPENIKKRVMRNAARRMMIKSKGKAALRGRDVDHANGNATDNRKSNLRIISKKANRSRK